MIKNWRAVANVLLRKPEDIVAGLMEAQTRVGDAFSFGAPHAALQAIPVQNRREKLE